MDTKKKEKNERKRRGKNDGFFLFLSDTLCTRIGRKKFLEGQPNFPMPFLYFEKKTSSI